jgi:tRNA G18 (ribose-2'-O)-methylase SpoU
MATGAVPPPPPMAQLWACRRLLVLPELVDITNLGLLLRSAATLGVDGVLYGKGPHVFDQRSVRVSMGTCWAIPVWRAEDPLPLLLQWQEKEPGTSIAAAALRPDSISSRRWQPTPRCALVLGQEGPGLSDEWLKACDTSVKIPMARGLDSLNVAAAGAILMHALVDP